MTTIGRVHLRTDTDDALATRMRGESALRALDIEPPAMPPRTILCIRAMPDPLPGGIDLRTSHAPRPIEWEHAARNAIRAALSRAVRVVDEFVPATADSVLFEDRAELLACATRDVVRGRSGWWWRHLLRGSVTFDVVLREWMRGPEYVAAALEILAVSREVIPFVRMMQADEAIQLLTYVLRAHGLEVFADEIIQAITKTAARNITQQQTPTQAPWHELVPEIEHAIASAIASEIGGLKPAAPQETAHELTLEQRLFAGITLALRRAPMLVRHRQSFTKKTVAWIAAMRAIEVDGVEEEKQKSRAHELTSQPSYSVTPSSIESTPAPAPAPSQSSSPSSPSPVEGVAKTAKKTKTTKARETPPITVAGTTITSQYAGIFFLLNAAIALELYDPYRDDEDLDVDIWEFLALTARALLDDDDIDEEDNVWPLLAELAQVSEGAVPGATDDPSPWPSPRATGRGELDEAIDRIRELLALTLDAERPERFLLHRYGRITLTPAHLDVVFSLAAHPIEIRLSGLDRDPGWIPAAGRHVNFHFD